MARDQLALFSPELREAGRKAFGVRQDALHADLARNFSLDLAVEVTRVRHELEQAEEILNGRAGAAFVGPAGRQEDQRNRIKDLAKKITNMYNTRDAQMAAINGSSAAWEHAFERRMQRLTESVKDTVDDSKTLRLRAKQRINRVKDRLSSVLVAANSLNSLRSKIEAVAAKTETVYTRTASDYGKVGVKSGKVQADITSWRVQLQNAIRSLGPALVHEIAARQQGHVNATVRMAAQEDRMTRIERDIRLLEKRLAESRASARREPAPAAPAPEPPAAAPAASAGRRGRQPQPSPPAAPPPPPQIGRAHV